ncbi:MAG: hypothetical protein ABI772_06805 [Bacteroidota bacterium]
MKKSLVLLLLLFSRENLSAQLLLHDAYEDNSQNWFTGDNGEAVFRIDSGYYHIESAGTVESQQLDTIITHAFYASTRGRMLSGAKKASYGMFLQAMDNDINRKLFFLVNPDGYYSCFMQKPDGTYPLARWTPSAYLQTGAAWNTIAFTGDSATLNLYINDFYITSFDNPFFLYNYAGVATFDTSVTDFDEIIVFSYPKLEKMFGVDYYNLPEVLNFLLKSEADGFRKIKGKALESSDHNEKLQEAKLWIPGAVSCFVSGKTYKAILGNFNTAKDAKAFYFNMRDKLSLALKDTQSSEGIDKNDLPYIIMGSEVEGKIAKPSLDLYITSTTEKEGNIIYSVAIDIE